MKIRVQMKDPDTLADAVHEAVVMRPVPGLSEREFSIVAEGRQEEITDECVKRWFRYGEYLLVEIDTDDWTITVLPASEC
jgi:hypothetical protein